MDVNGVAYVLAGLQHFAWLAETGRIKHNPAKVVKLVEQEVSPPRHLSDQEKQVVEKIAWV
jgi:site-specific recombinase XerC